MLKLFATLVVLVTTFLPATSACAKDTTASMSLSDSLNPPAPDPQEGKIPTVFSHLKRYHRVDERKYIWHGVYEDGTPAAVYQWDVYNKYFAQCSGGTATDGITRDLNCVGNMPEPGRPADKSKFIVLNVQPGPNTTPADIRDSLHDISQNAQFDKHTRVLPVGSWIHIPPPKDADYPDQMRTIDCVVPNHDGFACITSGKHGFNIDKTGTHLF